MFGPQPGHVWATRFPQLIWAYRGPLSDSSIVYQTCLAPGSDMSGQALLHSG
jgi:hypothetical protein